MTTLLLSYKITILDHRGGMKEAYKVLKFFMKELIIYARLRQW